MVNQSSCIVVNDYNWQVDFASILKVAAHFPFEETAFVTQVGVCSAILQSKYKVRVWLLLLASLRSVGIYAVASSCRHEEETVQHSHNQVQHKGIGRGTCRYTLAHDNQRTG